MMMSFRENLSSNSDDLQPPSCDLKQPHSLSQPYSRQQPHNLSQPYSRQHLISHEDQSSPKLNILRQPHSLDGGRGPGQEFLSWKTFRKLGAKKAWRLDKNKFAFKIHQF